MLQDELIERIRSLYPDSSTEVSGEGCNFQIQVVSTMFDGMKLLDRQRTLLGLFRDEIASGALHALTIKANTPIEILAKRESTG